MKKCIIEGCNRKHMAKGLCTTHYAQLPEQKERRKNDRNQPEQKERVKKYYQLPEIKERNKLQHKEYCQRPEIKEQTRKSYLLYTYNITLEQYDQMFKDQNGCCKFCNRSQSEFQKILSVDHDHNCCPGAKSCGKCVRGLLCQRCNTLLGFIEKHPELIRRMLERINENKRSY